MIPEPHHASRRADVAATCITAGGSALLVAAGAALGWVGVSLAVLLVGLVAACTVPHLVRVAQPRGTLVVLAGCAVVMTVVDLSLAKAGNLRWVAVVLAVGLAGAFLHELRRTDGRARLVTSIAGTCVGLAALASGAFYAQAMRSYDSWWAVTLTACVAAVAAAAYALWWGRERVALGVCAAGAVVFALLATMVSGGWTALSCLVAGVVASAAARLCASELHERRRPPIAVATGVLPVLLVGVVPYAVLWLGAHLNGGS